VQPLLAHFYSINAGRNTEAPLLWRGLRQFDGVFASARLEYASPHYSVNVAPELQCPPPARSIRGIVFIRLSQSAIKTTEALAGFETLSLPALHRRDPCGFAFYVTHPIRSIVSQRSRCVRPLPRGFTGHVARPARSILN
jgi:hypothetical protein